MQNDLISRSALIHYLDNQIVKCYDEEERHALRSILWIVEEQPTAYDVEKVVEQLEGQMCKCVTYKDGYAQGWNNASQNAITIVRNGGEV